LSRRLSERVAPALVWRYACHAAMLGVAVVNESRPAPHLPDLVLDAVPRLEWVSRWNYHLWLLCYLPPALWLWRRDRRAFVHFLWVGGLLSLVRGACLPLTGLGPPDGPDVNAGLSSGQMLEAWVTLVDPFTTLFGDAARLHLTKDLFFSGHTATTLLLWLYCRGRGALARVALAGHVLVVASVFLAHLHYTVDVVGAYAITWCVYAATNRASAGATS
jgi:hypothetical protein